MFLFKLLVKPTSEEEEMTVSDSLTAGVEHLSSLQCLDLAYNLLTEHTHLAPLSHLHNLNMVRKCPLFNYLA